MPMFESVVGIDLSLSESAVSVLSLNDDGSTTHQAYLIRERADDFIRRADMIRRAILEVIRVHAPAPPFILIESPALLARGRAIYQIFGLNAIVRHGLHCAGIQWTEVAPSLLKKYCTGKGNSPKQTIILETYKRFGYSPANDNDADAYVLSAIGSALLGWSQPTNAAQREVLSVIRRNNPFLNEILKEA